MQQWKANECLLEWGMEQGKIKGERKFEGNDKVFVCFDCIDGFVSEIYVHLHLQLYIIICL